MWEVLRLLKQSSLSVERSMFCAKQLTALTISNVCCCDRSKTTVTAGGMQFSCKTSYGIKVMLRLIAPKVSKKVNAFSVLSIVINFICRIATTFIVDYTFALPTHIHILQRTSNRNIETNYACVQVNFSSGSLIGFARERQPTISLCHLRRRSVPYSQLVLYNGDWLTLFNG